MQKYLCTVFNYPLYRPQRAVKLSNHDVSARIVPVLNQIETLGFARPVIRGGAIRDAFLQIEPHDYDAMVGAAQGDDGLDFPSVRDPRAPDMYGAWLEARPNVTSVEFRRPRMTVGKFAMFTLEMATVDHPIDLLIQDGAITAGACTMESEATMNAVAVSSDGIFAHPRFLQDMKDHVFRPTYSNLRNAVNAPRRYINKFLPRDPNLSYQFMPKG